MGPLIVRGLAAAASAIRAASKNPAVRKAAASAARKAGELFSRTKTAVLEICKDASRRASLIAAAARKQINVWRLRRWAKTKGYVRRKDGNIERWDDPVTGEWRLKIKHEGSMRPGLEKGSQVPRADARTGPGDYVNPLTGQTGKEAGTHIPLQ